MDQGSLPREGFAQSPYRAVFERAAVGIARVGIDGAFLEVNDRVCAITGYAREDLLGHGFQAITHPEDLETDLEYLGQLLAGRIDSYTLEKRYIHKNGDNVWINLTVSLVRGDEGEPLFFIATIEDIGSRKRAETAVTESEARLRLLLDQLFAFVGVLSADGILLHANKAPLDAAGIRLEDVAGKPFDEAYWWSYDPAVQERLRDAMARARGGEVVRYDVPVRMAGGRLMHIDFQIAPMRAQDGRVIGLIPSAIDIEERKAAERHRELLLAELNHRVKNTLTIVQSIAVRSFRDLPDADARLHGFEQRLLALSGAHNLLTQSNWEPTRLDQVAEQVISGSGASRERFRLQGPHIALQPKTAVIVALALHELATNAIKYGALSGPEGTVDLTWCNEEDDPGRLWIEWRESGGPPVRPPSHKGFGSRMIERALAIELNGEATMEFHPEGLVCRLRGTLPRATGTEASDA